MTDLRRKYGPHHGAILRSRRREFAREMEGLKQSGRMTERERMEVGSTRRTGMEQAGQTRRTGMERAGTIEGQRLSDLGAMAMERLRGERAYELQRMEGRQALEQAKSKPGELKSFTFEQEGTKYPGFYDPNTRKTIYPTYPGQEASEAAIAQQDRWRKAGKPTLTKFLGMSLAEQEPYLDWLQKESPEDFRSLAKQYEMLTAQKEKIPESESAIAPEGYLGQSIYKPGGTYRNY